MVTPSCCIGKVGIPIFWEVKDTFLGRVYGLSLGVQNMPQGKVG